MVVDTAPAPLGYRRGLPCPSMPRRSSSRASLPLSWSRRTKVVYRQHVCMSPPPHCIHLHTHCTSQSLSFFQSVASDALYVCVIPTSNAHPSRLPLYSAPPTPLHPAPPPPHPPTPQVAASSSWGPSRTTSMHRPTGTFLYRTSPRNHLTPASGMLM